LGQDRYAIEAAYKRGGRGGKGSKDSDIFPKKPPGLRFNETDVLVVIAKTNDGKRIGATFYFSLKPDGTFEEAILGKDAAKARRHNLASFLRYYV